MKCTRPCSKAYSRITERLGLEYLAVEADTGLMGGSFSHEFIILAEQGEEVMVLCPHCGYSAKQEQAIFKAGIKIFRKKIKKN
ncbi:MAG: hypothetical protein U5N58_10355 [Actinomycetota bacterium]|nr:hypothetical protein [Actinomycetota bacterium]